MLKLGTAKRCITPPAPVRMCGYATRTETFEAVKEDIWVRVHHLHDSNIQLTIVYADLLWWNTDFIVRIRAELEKALGIPANSVLFVASHNHSGPGTGNCFTPLLETGDTAYSDFLAHQVIEAIKAAQSDVEQVTVRRFGTQCAMNVYRRVQTKNGIQMWPNYSVPADNHLTVLGFYRLNKSLKGTMIHYPCHANLSNENFIQPDYPGITLRMLDETFSNSLSVFLQGCTADLRPNSVLGNRFIPCDYARVLVFAQNFFEICRDLLAEDGVQLESALDISKLSVKLPLEQNFDRDSVNNALKASDEAIRQWAEKILEKDLRPYETMEITRVVLAGQTLFTFNAEVSQFYAAYARTICPGAICVGYANGMIGYIPTSVQIGEGGYEPKDSTTYFALAGSFSPKIEELIHKAMDNLMKLK